jgi:hypothetical protein
MLASIIARELMHARGEHNTGRPPDDAARGLSYSVDNARLVSRVSDEIP